MMTSSTQSCFKNSLVSTNPHPKSGVHVALVEELNRGHFLHRVKRVSHYSQYKVGLMPSYEPLMISFKSHIAKNCLNLKNQHWKNQ